ncbi:hypothetical protein ACVI1N_006523 [Sinorhizobium medicae]
MHGAHPTSLGSIRLERPVEIHLEFMKAAVRWMIALELWFVGAYGDALEFP